MTPAQHLGRLRTVTGAIPASAIEGPVLAHEHLQIDLRWPRRAQSDPRRWLDEESRVSAELDALRQDHGLSLVVDLTGMKVGRNAATLARISARSQVAVVAATGFLAEPFHPEFISTADAETIAQRLLAEIGFGLDGTTIVPGVIGEIGTWPRAGAGTPTEQEERCLRAAALAGLESGLSVATHGPSGLAQLEILIDQGLPADRVAVGHQDLCDDPAVPRKIAELGGYVSFGLLGRGDLTTKVRRILEFLDSGHGDRLLLSNGISRMADLAAYDGPGYGHLFTEIVPALKAAGVPDPTLRAILRDNPLRWLTGATA
jgi:predicted metal-dependent phosphotriesterase family hydrolase